MNRLQRQIFSFAAIVALTATLSSLYLTLGMGLIPCRLCWYQRILMYPLSVILPFAIYKSDADFYLLVLPFSVFGGALAAWHSLIQISPNTRCGFFGCSARQLELLGFLTIPNLALISFAVITFSMMAVWWQEKNIQSEN